MGLKEKTKHLSPLKWKILARKNRGLLEVRAGCNANCNGFSLSLQFPCKTDAAKSPKRFFGNLPLISLFPSNLAEGLWPLSL